MHKSQNQVDFSSGAGVDQNSWRTTNVSTTELDEVKWEEFAVCFAEVRPVCDNKYVSMEGLSFGDVITEEYFHFRTRYIKNITKEMRISFHQRIFEIKRIINHQEKDRILSIIALEV